LIFPRRKKGQSAVETAFAIPVFGILFLIGFQLYAITWTAQALHVRARYAAMADADHKPCAGMGFSGRAMGRRVHRYPESLTVQRDTRLMQGAGTGNQMTQTAYIVCR
jgi:hypothetical protein